MPSERDYYNAAAFTTGYVYLQPDIGLPRASRASRWSSPSCGCSGGDQRWDSPIPPGYWHRHSWGGSSVYLATHTEIFAAAAVAGAPITDLVSNYGNHHWSSGIAETDHRNGPAAYAGCRSTKTAGAIGIRPLQAHHDDDAASGGGRR
jgi:hypothetical protein